jgi:hypothetical protein
MAGYEGIPGNKLADKEERRVAKGLTSDKDALPKLLRRSLHTNPSAILRNNNTAIKQKWTNDWRNSKRGQTISKTDKSTPFSRFLHSISNANTSHSLASLVT